MDKDESKLDLAVRFYNAHKRIKQYSKEVKDIKNQIQITRNETEKDKMKAKISEINKLLRQLSNEAEGLL